MFVRLLIAAVGATAVIGVLLALLAWLSYREPGNDAMSTVDNTRVFESWFRRRSAAPSGFELIDRGVIVPVDRAADLLRTCSRPSVSPIEGYWRPNAGMVRELETGLDAALAERNDLEPLDRYARQYAGVVSGGRRLIYGSFVLFRYAGDDWRTNVVQLCDGGNAAFGVDFDVAAKSFGELRINGAF